MHHTPIIVQHWAKIGIIFGEKTKKIMKQSLFTSKVRWILQKTAGIFIVCKIERRKRNEKWRKHPEHSGKYRRSKRGTGIKESEESEKMRKNLEKDVNFEKTWPTFGKVEILDI